MMGWYSACMRDTECVLVPDVICHTRVNYSYSTRKLSQQILFVAQSSELRDMHGSAQTMTREK